MNTFGKNKMRTKSLPPAWLTFACLCLAAFSSCTERIDIRTGEGEAHLVVYGILSDRPGVHTVRISRSVGYFDEHLPQGISGAEVTIGDGEEIFTLRETEGQAGVYRTEEQVAGKPGSTYTLSIRLDFDGDGQAEAYRATSCMPFPARVDSIGYRNSEMLPHYLEILFWGQMPEGEGNHLAILFETSRVQAEASLEDFLVLDDAFIGERDMLGVPCYYHDLDELDLETGDTLAIRVDAITEEYAFFIRQARSQMRGTQPLFGGPPANVETNIVPETPSVHIPVAGFFTALSSTGASVVYQK
jgi:hypothetical protein